MKIILMTVALLLSAAAGPTITQAERDKAVAELESSEKAFIGATNGLSDAQWNFKPAPDRWSIAECAEHIGVTEGLIFTIITVQVLKGPAEPEKRSQVKVTDDQLLAMTADRSTKFKAPESIQPTHRWTTPAEINKNVLDTRAKTIVFVTTTDLDLRDHYMDHPAFKTIDTYQWMLLMSAHMRRHTAQILEVEADPNFPKH